MAKEKSAVQNPESVETLTETSNDVITQNDVVGTKVDEVVDTITNTEVIDQTTVTPEPESELIKTSTPEPESELIKTSTPEPESELIETSTPEVLDQTILPLPEAELIESSTPELNDAKESTLPDEAPVRAKIISMTVRPTGSFVM